MENINESNPELDDFNKEMEKYMCAIWIWGDTTPCGGDITNAKMKCKCGRFICLNCENKKYYNEASCRFCKSTLPEQFNPEIRYGFYSQEAIKAGNGDNIYLDLEGKETLITYLSKTSILDKNEYKWEDAQYVGPVLKFVRKNIHSKFYDKQITQTFENKYVKNGADIFPSHINKNDIPLSYTSEVDLSFIINGEGKIEPQFQLYIQCSMLPKSEEEKKAEQAVMNRIKIIPFKYKNEEDDKLPDNDMESVD